MYAEEMMKKAMDKVAMEGLKIGVLLDLRMIENMIDPMAKWVEPRMCDWMTVSSNRLTSSTAVMAISKLLASHCYRIE